MSDGKEMRCRSDHATNQSVYRAEGNAFSFYPILLNFKTISSRFWWEPQNSVIVQSVQCHCNVQDRTSKRTPQSRKFENPCICTSARCCTWRRRFSCAIATASRRMSSLAITLFEMFNEQLISESPAEVRSFIMQTRSCLTAAKCRPAICAPSSNVAVQAGGGWGSVQSSVYLRHITTGLTHCWSPTTGSENFCFKKPPFPALNAHSSLRVLAAHYDGADTSCQPHFFKISGSAAGDHCSQTQLSICVAFTALL